MNRQHETFGYYAHGIGPETATLPDDWKSRLVKVENANTGGITGWCLSPPDLAISKLAAGRPKDLQYVRGMLHARLVARADIEALFDKLPPPTAAGVAARLDALSAEWGA